MEQNLHTCYSSPSSSQEEEDYINMEVDHPSFNSSIFSQSTSNEFEFQSFSSSSDRENQTTTSPADELFYMGKLLPLHLPPRLEMVHKILQKPDSQYELDDEPFTTPLFTPSSNTPFESCNISPSESCHVSRELDPNEYLSEYFSGFQEKQTWTLKNLKIIKQSSSKKWTSYLKSFFTKSSGCSNEHSSAAADQRHVNSHCKTGKINHAPFGQIKYKNDLKLVEDHRGSGGHRRSFSGAFKRLSKPKTTSSSSSSSTNPNPVNLNRNVFKRSISSNSEMESPIQAAIAHCKRSQRVVLTLS